MTGLRPIAGLAAQIGSRPLLTGWVTIPDPMVASVVAREEVDAVTIDLQHTAIGLHDVVRLLPAIHAEGKPMLTRIPVGDFALASRLIDLGTSAVIAPMINTVDDARQLAAFCKYPPLGQRSWGAFNAVPLSGLTPGDYFLQANGMAKTFAMIETREAMDALDDILSVNGIDGVFVGPADLSIALSGAKAPDPGGALVTDAIRQIIARAKNAGKSFAIFAHTATRAKEFVGMGADLVAVESDAAMLRAGIRAAVSTARS